MVYLVSWVQVLVSTRTGHIPLTCVLNMFECTHRYIFLYMYLYFSVASHITQRFRFWTLDQLYTLGTGQFLHLSRAKDTPKNATLPNLNMEPENGTLEVRRFLLETILFRFQPLNLGKCTLSNHQLSDNWLVVSKIFCFHPYLGK